MRRPAPHARAMDITTDTVFIPGATSGIGLALAVRLRAHGATVIIGGRRRELLDSLATEHHLGAVHLDTTDPASVRAAAAEVTERWPELNAVVLMAGIMAAEDWRTAEALETAESVVTTNVLGPVRLVAALLDHLRTRPAASIVTVSSGLAFVPLQITPSYNASKAFIHMFSESLRLQLAGTGVRVQELVPPAVRTDLMPGHADHPHGMPLDEYADEVISLLQDRPEASEILVERVRPLRYAEARGSYAEVVGALNPGSSVS